LADLRALLGQRPCDHPVAVGAGRRQLQHPARLGAVVAQLVHLERQAFEFRARRLLGVAPGRFEALQLDDRLRLGHFGLEQDFLRDEPLGEELLVPHVLQPE